MIGSPQNNFKTMQPPQTTPQPRNVMLSNALRNPQGNDQEERRPQEQYETNEQNEQYRQPQINQNTSQPGFSATPIPFNSISLKNIIPSAYLPQQSNAAPGMMSSNQYGQPTPQMPSWVRPQSNASFNMQPQIPGANADGMNQGGPMGLQQSQGQNRYGVGLARQQNVQVGQ